MKRRLDHLLSEKGIVSTRSQAESYIKLGQVKVNGKVETKPGYMADEAALIEFTGTEQYVSRAGLKLSSVATALHLDFAGKVVLDVGSSTGGFTDYALRHGASKVIAVEVGTDQLHPSLHGNPQIELHEQTDIREFTPSETPDMVVIDVSFVSLRNILPSVAAMSGSKTEVIAMVKPQFEAGHEYKHKGVIKNDAMRREVLQGFEQWAKTLFFIQDKADSDVAGAKGNRERFYLLKRLAKPAANVRN